MVALLQAIKALLASHATTILRHAGRIVLLGLAFSFAVLVGLIYFIIFLTHVLALLVGTTLALAIMTLVAGFACVLFILAIRREGRRLVRAHRAHVEEERLTLQAAAVEAVAAGKAGAGIAGVSASLAAVIVLILRRLGSGEAAEAAAPGGAEGEPPPEV